MNGKQAAISIHFRSAAGVGNETPAAIVGVGMACLLYAVLFWFSYRLFSLWDFDVSPLPPVVAGIGVILALAISNLMIGDKGQYGKVCVAVAFLALFILLALLSSREFRYGLNCFADQMEIMRIEASGCMHRRFDTGNDPAQSAAVFSMFFGAAVAALSYLVAYEGNRITLFVMPGLLVAILCLRLAEPDESMMLVIAVLLLTCAVRFTIDSSALRRKRGVLEGSAVILMAFLLVSAGALFCMNGTSDNAASLQQKVQDKYHAVRYEKNRNPLPEGNMLDVGALKATGRVSLTVSMTKPEGVYLRGFVGEQYENGRWNRQDKKFYPKNYELFYWLHKKGFYAQSQRAQLYRLMKAPKAGKMTVENVSACRKYNYAPYGLDQEKSYITNPAGIGDAEILRDGDALSVTMSYIPKTVYRSYLLQQDLSSYHGGSKALDAYRNEEAAYRETVYKYYLKIPQDVEKTLKSCLGKKESLTTSEAKIRILQYLDHNIKYRAEVKSNQQKELITWFLKEKKTGHCVHYAAASAMMLRYYGIPARYVEGFVITSPQAKKMEPESPFPVTEKYAHAWAEYYLDGVGWIPFETVPDKRDANMYGAAGSPTTQDDSNDTGTGSKSKGSSAEQDQEKKVSDKTDFDNPINNLKKIFAFRKAWVVGLTILALLLLAVFICIRRMRINRFVKTFEGSDVRRGLINAFAYSEFLSRRNRTRDENETDPEWETMYRLAKEANDIAMYSSGVIHEIHRQDVIALKDRTLQKYREGRNLIQTIYDRFIAGIY